VRRILPFVLLVFAVPALSGCLAGAVVGATGRVVGTTAKVAVKTTGAVVDVVTPGDDDEDKDDDRR
jgi:small ligand-binding sensory domain FIST